MCNVALEKASIDVFSAGDPAQQTTSRALTAVLLVPLRAPHRRLCARGDEARGVTEGRERHDDGGGVVRGRRFLWDHGCRNPAVLSHDATKANLERRLRRATAPSTFSFFFLLKSPILDQMRRRERFGMRSWTMGRQRKTPCML